MSLLLSVPIGPLKKFSIRLGAAQVVKKEVKAELSLGWGWPLPLPERFVETPPYCPSIFKL